MSLKSWPEGGAIVYCEGAFRTTNGKTAHGLVRRTRRYDVLSVVDSTCAGEDAGTLLDGAPADIPLLASVDEAVEHSAGGPVAATHLVVGLAPDGGRLPERALRDVRRAIAHGLHVDCGLHDLLGDDPELVALAERHGVRLRDIRRPPPRSELHFFSGKIEEVGATTVAVLGTDSAVGKRTTAWLLADALAAAGLHAELVGTGQTAWLQGARWGVVMDSLVNDFVAGEIEHAVWQCWQDARPDVILIEGQGSLLNPAYPGGFEILAAGRPAGIVLQHAPARGDYDGFPGYPIHPIERQIEALEIVSDRPVIALTVNREGLAQEGVAAACEELARRTDRPAVEPLAGDLAPVVEAIARLHRHRGQRP